MWICKKIDPVVDIVIIGFGVRSKRFIEIFLESKELKGVNIILISKDSFIFLNKDVQNINACKESYVDLYKYCKERNILFINEKIDHIDSINKTIHFYSDRNNLNYDYLLCDFDYKSSYLLNKDLSNMNIYPYKNINLFFYYIHIIYLSLIQASKANNNNFINNYYKWKSYFTEHITIKKFYNFFSYNDKYVEDIFLMYDKVVSGFNFDIENGDVTPIDNTSNVGQGIVLSSEIKNMQTNQKNENDNCISLLLLSDNNDLGKMIYLSIIENIKEIASYVKIKYIYIESDTHINDKKTKIDFCENYEIIRSVESINKIDNNYVIKCVCNKNEIVLYNYNECINVTNIKYPSYFYNSKYNILNSDTINTFCQYKNDNNIYFLNQINNYNDYTVCRTIYLNIYNSVFKNEYISIEEVKRQENEKNENIKRENPSCDNQMSSTSNILDTCEAKDKNNCSDINKNLKTKTNNDLPEYIYDFYKKEYEKRLIVRKNTTYQISNKVEEDPNENNTPKGKSGKWTIIVKNSKIENKQITNIEKSEKIDLYIKESIDKIINRNTCGGCGSKVPSNVLSNSLKSLNIYTSPNVYLGVEGCDDCCIFVHSKSKRSEESPALVQTIDFFKSFIDDEYILGEVIAIHCLSDIYSMGGTGICALCVLIIKDNIEKKLQQRLENILTGCCQKLKEEKCVLSGGHTCAGTENYVGLAVTGKIKKKKNNNKDKEEIRKSQNNESVLDKTNQVGNNSINKVNELNEAYHFLPKGSIEVKPGDVIITTKVFGFGFIMAAHISKKAKARWIYNCLDEMLISNRKGGLYFLKNNAKACTDVTGFGILGHLNEMIKCSRREYYIKCVSNNISNNEINQKGNDNKCNELDNINFIGAKINLNKINIAEGVQECIQNNIYSSMYKKNHYLCNNIINLDEAILNDKYGILFDPQTSGGLMAIVEREHANTILSDLKNMGYQNSSIIGEIINLQYDKYQNVSIDQITLSDYINTENSIYIEC
ncbi:selenide water dikinase, putative [Plasmodium yoelii]|uniref:Selenide water dikinase n=2 Tax=Plasmodium yoelii TaxID=5861 RepID=A0AAE9WMT2_PLAYO|nr:selenide water dikinase, putative [Plasmodium yoelii]WBY56665.1 selenide water dikinase [Plasmodium yoelii yoelii]CDU17508.1 selenophosphate synthetase, putative [Plasmodium yoelii]VTZ77292.1 selenide water dikinase, putative [Plasmodium yoelii]|eukprot:XP_022811937.1 selenide water dikinase, putative [Plasmodium yoelii]